ncbi:hypothetical protein [Nocardia niigatensis]|uniref:hypothetical protein n=1 Tax=Nocardia niigatensis TaxID=209249 RepID=UPI00068801DF|nr:hypothetical protein [Nocardia niigatensis]
MCEPRQPMGFGEITFDALFHRTPVQWGMRGDPHLWDALRDRFRGQPMPCEFWDVRNAVEAGMAEILGIELGVVRFRETDHVAIPRFEVGYGITDGTVSLRWWRNTGIPLLIDRAAAVRAGELIPRPRWEPPPYVPHQGPFVPPDSPDLPPPGPDLSPPPPPVGSGGWLPPLR